ncbi:hypothetical protein KCU73_g120, partial [Aureobasidium melanogenum]
MPVELSDLVSSSRSSGTIWGWVGRQACIVETRRYESREVHDLETSTCYKLVLQHDECQPARTRRVDLCLTSLCSVSQTLSWLQAAIMLEPRVSSQMRHDVLSQKR